MPLVKHIYIFRSVFALHSFKSWDCLRINGDILIKFSLSLITQSSLGWATIALLSR